MSPLLGVCILSVSALVALAGCGGGAHPPKLATPAGGEKSIPVVRHYTGCHYYRHRRVCPKPHPTPKPTPASGCGVERWAVKTLTDPGANAVNPTPQDTTIASLVAIPPPVNPTDRVAPVETTTWRIRAHLDAYKQEADSDIHVAVHDDRGNTMIVELPSPSCDQGSTVASQIASARDAFTAKYGQPSGQYQPLAGDATVTGVGFFDRLHGQRGLAPNGIELHPVTAFGP